MSTTNILSLWEMNLMREFDFSSEKEIKLNGGTQFNFLIAITTMPVYCW